ncbi:MAG: hypothetical protein ABI743_02475 [bacterium]
MPRLLLLLLATLATGCSQPGQQSQPVAAPVVPAPAPAPERDAALGCNLTLTNPHLSGQFRLAEVVASATVLGSVRSWSWNFGGGAYPNTSTQASPTVLLMTTGTFTGSVTAYDTCGFPTTRTWSYTTFPPQFYQWTTTEIYPPLPPNPAQPGGGEASMVAFGPGTALAEYDTTNQDLRFITAPNRAGVVNNWNTGHSVDAYGNTGRTPSLVLDSGGYPRIAYFDENQSDLRIAVANSTNPTNSTHWLRYNLDSIGIVGKNPKLITAPNQLVVSYFDETNGNLKILASLNTSAPLSSASWTNLQFPAQAGIEGKWSSLAIYNGKLLVAYVGANGETRFGWTPLSATPSWTVHTLEGTDSTSPRAQLAVSATGYPSVAYRGTGDVLRVARGTVQTPGSAGQWTIHTAVGDPTVLVNVACDAMYHRSKLVVAYVGTANIEGFPPNPLPYMFTAQAITLTPAWRADWFSSVTATDVNTGSIDACRASMVGFPTPGVGQIAVMFDYFLHDTKVYGITDYIIPQPE